MGLNLVQNKIRQTQSLDQSSGVICTFSPPAGGAGLFLCVSFWEVSCGDGDPDREAVGDGGGLISIPDLY